MSGKECVVDIGLSEDFGEAYNCAQTDTMHILQAFRRLPFNSLEKLNILRSDGR